MTTPQIITPGVHAVPAGIYHADALTPQPALSASIIHTMCSQSCWHAKAAHPRLSETARLEDTAEHFDIGTVAHALLLEGVEVVEVIDAKDWRTNAAKDARDSARAVGKTPLLKKHWLDVQAMAEAFHVQIAQFTDGSQHMFSNGAPEQTLIWREGELWCKARLDWLSGNHGNIYDYKTADDANPDRVSRAMFGNGWDVKAAWYLRGLKAVSGAEAAFRFAVQEKAPPYALSVNALGPAAMTLAEKKILWALEMWERCLSTGEWPGYPLRTCYAELPAHIENAWLAKEIR